MNEFVEFGIYVKFFNFILRFWIFFWIRGKNSKKIQTYSEKPTNLFNIENENFNCLFIGRLYFLPIRW